MTEPDRLPDVRLEFDCEAAPGALWQVRSLELEESLSGLFEARVELVCEDTAVDPTALLGADATVRLDRRDVVRTLGGVVDQVEDAGRVQDQVWARVRLVPAVRLLEHRGDTRLWQGVSGLEVAVEVLRAGLRERGRELVTDALVRSDYPCRPMVVQYGERDLVFVRRLLEREGVAWRLEEDSERLVLEDSPDHWEPVLLAEDRETLRVAADREELAEVEALLELRWSRALTPGAVRLRGYDWTQPSQAPERTAVGEGSEVYLPSFEEGPELDADAQLNRLTRDGERLTGTSNLVGLAPGRHFLLEGDARRYLVTRVCQRLHQGDDALTGYTNTFEAAPLDTRPWLPALETPRPRIVGPQTALVVGPEGEDIHTDAEGRVKVRFGWDRVHGLHDDSSAWVRVSQAWAGPGFGSVQLPRVGTEVVVEFVDGDPERPLITGCLHNGEARGSLELPVAKTQTALRTKSSPGGDGFNELRFEDAAGSECIFLHAQRNLRETIGHERHSCVHASRHTHVGVDERLTISGERWLTVEGDDTQTVGGSQVTTVQGDAHTRVEGSVELLTPSTAQFTADGSLRLVQGHPTTQALVSLEAGAVEQRAPDHWTASSEGPATLGGQTIHLVADECLELRQGGASLRMEGDTLVIEASAIRLVTGATQLSLAEGAELTASAAVVVKGSRVSID